MGSNVESFTVDHRTMKAPFIRKCGFYAHPEDISELYPVTKYDIRFYTPNSDKCMTTKGGHTIEHLFAQFIRSDKGIKGVIDVSGMFCLTGFYMTVFEMGYTVEDICKVMNNFVDYILKCEDKDVPAVNPIQCGNYVHHSLKEAKIIAQHIKDSGYFVPFKQ